ALAVRATLRAGGAVSGVSRSSGALAAPGAASVPAAAILVRGGIQTTGSPTFHPAPTTGAAAVADPLAALPSPSTIGMTNYGAEVLAGSAQATINPGIYSQISVSKGAVLTMNPGIYIIEGGGFTATGSAVVNGSGVFLYTAGSNSPGSGGSFGGITIGNSATCNLSAPSTGPYAGILIFQSRQNTRAFSLSGNAQPNLTGLIYAPSALVSVADSAKLPGTVVA